LVELDWLLIIVPGMRAWERVTGATRVIVAVAIEGIADTDKMRDSQGFKGL
jgi:hypothetical protein